MSALFLLTFSSFAGEALGPLDNDIPLAEAVRRANELFRDVQPLTEDEVVAAVKAIKLLHPDIKDGVYESYLRVVKERVFPKGMSFWHTTSWITPNGRFQVDWKDLRLEGHPATADERKEVLSKMPLGQKAEGEIQVGGFVYRIRSRFISAGARS